MKKIDPIIWSITDGHDSSINQFNYLTGESKHAELDKLIDEKHAFFTRYSKDAQRTMDSILYDLVDVCGWSVPSHLVYKRTHGTDSTTLEPSDAARGVITHLSRIGKTGSFDNVNSKILPHHMCHALSAYHCSPYNNCVVITWDGIGDGRFYSESVFRDGELVDYTSPRWFVGLGSIMRWVGHVCKYHISPHVDKLETSASLDYAGKVMGLSSYFEPGMPRDQHFREQVNQYKKLMDALPDYQAWLKGEFLQKETLDANPVRAWDKPWMQDLDHDRKIVWSSEDEIMHCAAVQQAGSETFFERLKSGKLAAKIKSADNNVIIAGGTALNVVTNAYVREKSEFNIFVPPDPADGGLSFGLSIWKAKQLGWKGYDHNNRPSRRISGIPFRTKGLGLDIPNARTVTSKEIADLLKEGKIIGLIQGNVENGPRALGNRSILCNPEFPDMRDKINSNIKNREWYRPFAPVCRLEDAPKWFSAKTFDNLEHMSFVVNVKEEYKDTFPSITHVDGTARLQTVTAHSNPLLYSILNHHENVLLNTSFNVQGKPILNDWPTAKKILDETDLDHIVFLNRHELQLFS